MSRQTHSRVQDDVADLQLGEATASPWLQHSRSVLARLLTHNSVTVKRATEAAFTQAKQLKWTPDQVQPFGHSQEEPEEDRGGEVILPCDRIPEATEAYLTPQDCCYKLVARIRKQQSVVDIQRTGCLSLRCHTLRTLRAAHAQGVAEHAGSHGRDLAVPAQRMPPCSMSRTPPVNPCARSSKACFWQVDSAPAAPIIS